MKLFDSKKVKKWILGLLALAVLSIVGGAALNTLLNQLDSITAGEGITVSLDVLKSSNTYVFAGLIFVVILILIFGSDKKSAKNVMKTKANGVESSLENSRFLSEKERTQLFPTVDYRKLSTVKKDGVPLYAYMKGNRMEVTLYPGAHCLVIGSTGSGKTTTFINPMIQILCEAKKGSSMVITDPKGELFQLHSQKLADNGYDVQVLDLRDAYASSRWNPLEDIFDQYTAYKEAAGGIKIHEDPYSEHRELTPVFCTEEDLNSASPWYEYRGSAYADKQTVIETVRTAQQKIYDNMYEDLHDLVSVLCPIESQDDPVWEKGARSILMAILLAMLEDRDNPALGMTKEKFNFYNLNKILSRSDDNYAQLKKYFEGRSTLSQAVTLSRQVLSAADNTLASYMSIAMDKMSMFNDNGLCAMTASTDIDPNDLADHPTALFLKIPDEKDTRHPLASVFILCLYKALIKKASSREDLSLPRNVYFILDEFGNMPRIEKFDKMITVGRSRKIWFSMVVQSYAQFNNVYGETVGDIIKSNCGIKLFIGSNDIETCKEFSELCGNMTVYTNSVSGASGQKAGDFSYSTSVQTRPLIYPSELQKLNNAQSSGNALAVTFGNFPLKCKYTPSYKCNLYEIGQMKLTESRHQPFRPNEAFYDIEMRNGFISSK